MHMYKCVLHMHVCAYIRTCVYTHIHVQICLCVDTMCAYVHSHTLIDLHVHADIHVCVRMYASRYRSVCVCMQILLYTRETRFEDTET